MPFNINDLVAKRPKPRTASDRTDLIAALGEQPETANLQPGPPPPSPTPKPTPQPKRKPTGLEGQGPAAPTK